MLNMRASVPTDTVLGGRDVVNRATPTPARCWDLIMDIVDLGDLDGDPWRATVNMQNEFIYEEIDTEPRYDLVDGVVYDSYLSARPVIPWLVKPAVVRDALYPLSRADYQGWLEDARDFLAAEVSVNQDGKVTLKTEFYDEVELEARSGATIPKG